MRLLVLLAACVVRCEALHRRDLYPYGVLHGDDLLDIGDDISSDEIPLQTNIAFYDSYFSSIFINVNGLLSFETDLPIFKSDLILPTRQIKLIAPFHADVDTRLSGNVYYRETQDPAILRKTEGYIHQSFPAHTSFRPRSLLIVTWDEVGYFNQQYDKTNTFQVLIASDSRDSFVGFLYPEDGINWTKGEGKYGLQAPDVPAQVGFDSGMDRHQRSYMVPGSGREQIRDIARRTNTEIEGLYLFHVGNTGDKEITIPDSDNRVAVNDRDSGAGDSVTCAEGGQGVCDANARCQDYAGGSCCHCLTPYFGNGYKCILTDVAQRVNGKVSGNINGVDILDEELHVYVVTKDGRVYTAISKLPAAIGFSMQSLYPIGGILGWLFAALTTPKAQNGFSITGGDLERVATVRYAAGGEAVTIRQQVVGSDADGYMRMTTEVTGTVPEISAAAEVIVEGTTEEYRRTSPGTITSFSQHTYKVDGVAHRFTLEQTITYKECDSKPLDDLDTQRLVISRPFMKYRDEEAIVRYATTNKMAPAVGGDPCKEMDMECDANADCNPAGASHHCQCRQGFYGDGLMGRCQDENECALNNHDCDYNAECINSPGSFSCSCNQGYSGDGKTCQRDHSCADLVCDFYANCVYDAENGEPKCECKAGYTGDGVYCERIEEGERQCNVINNCGANARCEYTERTFGYACRCLDGYRGDGFVCEPEPCDVANNCAGNARCLYDDTSRQYQCSCNPGFAGDGYQCEQAGCDVVDNCDRNAFCEFDYDERRYVCKCDEGYEGDGTYCRETVVDCNTINNCDLNAECRFDRTTGNYQCSCLAGYSGDGFSCRVTDCSRNPSMCDPNARCLPRGFDNVCECKSGFEGDGFSCRAQASGGSGMLMMARGMNIMDMPIQPTNTNRGKPTIYIPGQTAIGVDVDCYAKFFYWTDVSGKTISKARLDGTDSEVIVSGVGSPEGVSVDWIARNMYWTDSGLDRIEVSNLDGKNRKMLFDTDLINPRAIVVDPARGFLFWSDWNRNAPKIERANMDGTERKVLVDTDLGLPNGLTLDHEQQRLCWADAETHMIECVDYTGRGRRIVYDQAGWAFDLVYANNVFYWTDWDQKVLPNVNEYGGIPNTPLDLPPGGNGRVYGITLSRDQCPAGNNACGLNNGGCRFLCLPTPNGGRSCACPDDIDEQECNRIGLLLRK